MDNLKRNYGGLFVTKKIHLIQDLWKKISSNHELQGDHDF